MQAPLKMRDPTREFSFIIKMIIIFRYTAFIQPLIRQNMKKKNLACQMPNLAHFWHFPMVADRAVVPFIKVDQPAKHFQNLFRKCEMCHNAKFGTFFAFPNGGRWSSHLFNQSCKTLHKIFNDCFRNANCAEMANLASFWACAIIGKILSTF